MAASPKVLIINGPNLNMLGKREPSIYGQENLETIEADCLSYAASRGLSARCFQSNSEGDLVTAIQGALEDCAALVINPGAYSHTSIAILDALRAVKLPTVEVHLSNIHARESFRHHSYVSKEAWGLICGFGAFGYRMAIDAVANRLLETVET